MTYEEFKEKVSSVILTDDGNCPVTPVVQMLQGKWKLQILYELCIKCPMRFGELKKVLKPITNTALTNALKELEADELIQRMLLSGSLYPHLMEVEQTAESRMQQTMQELLKQNPAPNKERHQMEWVQHMNSLKAQAEELVINELIYS